jgi:hypothetical protein
MRNLRTRLARRWVTIYYRVFRGQKISWAPIPPAYLEHGLRDPKKVWKDTVSYPEPQTVTTMTIPWSEDDPPKVEGHWTPEGFVLDA